MLNRCNDCPNTFGNSSCSGDCEWRMQRVRENTEFQCAQKRKLSLYHCKYGYFMVAVVVQLWVADNNKQLPLKQSCLGGCRCNKSNSCRKCGKCNQVCFNNNVTCWCLFQTTKFEPAQFVCLSLCQCCLNCCC